MIRYFHKSLKDKNLRKLSKSKPGSMMVVTEANRDELEQVAKAYHVELADLVDIFDTQEIPRLELIEKTTLMIVRFPVSLEPDEPTTEHVFLIYHGRRLGLLAAGRLMIVDQMFDERKLVTTTQSAKFLLQFLLYISGRYRQKVNAIHKQLESVRNNIRQASTADIETLIQHEAVLNEYLLALVPMQSMYQQISLGKCIPLYAEDEALLEDMINSIAQSVDICKASVKQIVSLRDSFEIIVSNRLNQTVKLLTSVTIVLTIPTIISSIYGMNVDLPLDDTRAAFGVLIGLSVVMMGLVGWLFRINRWM